MKKSLAILFILLMLLTSCTAQASETGAPQSSVTPAGVDVSAFDLDFSNRELSGEWESRGAVTIAGNGSTAVRAGSSRPRVIREGRSNGSVTTCSRRG